MTDSCATCRWARPWTPAPDLLSSDPVFFHGGTVNEAIRCFRFPQSVTNALTYWCGEYMAKAKEAA